ncbi:Gmad2 immunoglobulin-like domain-containing protein [Paenibacillus sp.]|uniref:Gmad2 immunoglobulin-like domain-containing protein n=1 Tax=Paenibacillus sp. TaxID=58172 RepID=UPI002D4B004D|nr:Gmad2 immunoglobulin-like domain-containing protein [Paenibacillus sp.]HZG84336.1 Gmad2 immunoglobulin-like domain-containing protein [Paenibacillus sp.]
MRKRVALLALLFVLALTSACGGGGGGTAAEPPADNPAAEPEPSEAKALDRGYVVKKEAGRWLVTAYVEQDAGPRIDAFSFEVNGETALQTEDGQSLGEDDIQVGDQIEVWHTGPIQESYPAQAVASKIVVHPDEETAAAEGTIDRTAAVQAALSAQAETSGVWSVKAAARNAESARWDVELVRQEAVDQPVSLKIDAKSGEIVKPVAENAAFRVYAPAPSTEADSGFIVEGEARVFEAAFSWTLEDGHAILAEGHEMASAGAPAWGSFRFKVNYEHAQQPNMMLVLFVHSAKDGSVEQELVIPLKVPEGRIKYTTE